MDEGKRMVEYGLNSGDGRIDVVEYYCKLF